MARKGDTEGEALTERDGSRLPRFGPFRGEMGTVTWNRIKGFIMLLDER